VWPARLALSALIPLMLISCDRLIFQPDRLRYLTPEQYGLWHETVRFRSADGTILNGWFLPARGRVLGTVVHFHGNAANITNHLYEVRWLPEAGYAVLMFDYRGYGDSAGSASRAGAVADGVAALQYVRGRKDVDPQRLVVFGQSLGGALAISALERAGTEGVRALVVEGAFLSYRDVVRRIVADGWLTWIFQYPVAYGFFSDEYSPADSLKALSAVPLLVIHGEADRTIPIGAGRALYDAFPGPEKEFWSIPGAGHLEVFGAPGSPWRDRLLAYLGKRLGKPQ
jgi:hypothetical protein